MRSTALPQTQPPPDSPVTEASRRKRPRTLSEAPLRRLARLQHVALMRLQLKLTGDTHALLLDLGDKLRSQLLRHAGEDGVIPLDAGSAIIDFAAIAWREAFDEWKRRFQAARIQAVLIMFASLARYHEHFIGLVKPQAESLIQEQLLGIVPEPFFEPQLAEVIQAADDRIYSDGFKLSDRIWNLDQKSFNGIQSITRETIATGDSAYNAAKRLESHLGAGQDCPRWTSTRLRLTKTEIAAGDRRGLISGSPCASKGVAYNALRLARNEIQIAHGNATDAIFARQPWVEKEQINLSPSHPPINCECEDIVAGGEGGDGIYPKGEITLPVHVQCLCYKTAVLMKDDEFIGRMRGWMTGQAEWPEMNEYSKWVGGTRDSITNTLAVGSVAYNQLALPFMNWLNGDAKEMEKLLQ